MLWKAYSIFLGTLFVLNYGELDFSVYEYIDFSISIIALLGLSSFAFGKRLFKAVFWKYILIIVVIWDFTYAMFLPLPLMISTPRYIIYLTGLMLLLPEYYGLYLFAFKKLIVTASKSV